MNPSYFQDWLLQIYAPTLLVYSTPHSEKIILKNNLSPAEFIRPFTNFTDTISFSVSDKFSISMKNFRLDTYDYYKFKKFTPDETNHLLEQVYIQNEPNVSTKTPSLNLKKREEFLKSLNLNYNFPWHSEYERVFIESMFFNEFDPYQQPFGYTFICSIDDSTEELKKLKRKENIPMLLSEGIYEILMPSMILIIHDRQDSKLSSEEVFKKVEQIRTENSRFFVYFIELNTQTEKDIDLKDIWTSLIHKTDKYNPKNLNVKKEKGNLISLSEREELKAAFLKFVTDFIKPHLQKTIVLYDNEISENKKGFKYRITSLFNKTEKIEYIPSLGIYKLTPIEKKLLLLSTIQFFFRDYDDAAENLKILRDDIKQKSIIHYNIYSEMLCLCLFLSGKYKEIDFDSCFLNYQKSKISSKFIVRYIFMHVRMLEHQRRFLEIPKVIIRITSESNNNFLIHPLPFEKAAIYFLLDPTQQQARKFCFYMFLAGLTYYGQTELDMRSYCLYSFNLINNFFIYSNPSFLKAKEYIQNQMAEISSKFGKYELSSKFYLNCISLSLFKFDNIDQQVLSFKSFIKSVREFTNREHELCLSKKYTLRDFRVPDIINSTVITYEEQDFSLLKHKGWKVFLPYSKVEKDYINFSETDCIVLKNLDCLADNRHFKNKKKTFRSFVGKKIHVKIQMKNSFNSSIYISSVNLLTQYEDSDKLNSDVELEAQSPTLEMRSINSYTLSVIPKRVGELMILGIEVKIFDVIFRHYFNEYDIREETNLYKAKFDTPDNYKVIKYTIQNEESDIITQLVNKQKPLMQYEFNNINAKIINNSNFNIKKFCIYFEGNDIFINNYILYEKNIKQGEVFDFDIPLCPQVSGKFNNKIIIKFEDEYKFKDIEIKRYCIPLEVIPSITHEIVEKVILVDSKVKRMQLNAKISYSNKETLPEDLYINEITGQELILNSSLFNKHSFGWERLDYKEKELVYYYGKVTFDRENKKNRKLSKFDSNNRLQLIQGLSFNSKHIVEEEVDELFNKSLNENSKYIITNAINNKFSKDTILITFTLQTKRTSINCGIFHNIKIVNPVYDRKFVLSSIRKNIESIISHSKINDNLNLVNVNLKINSLFNCLDLSSYEIFVKEDTDFNWLGLKRKIIRQCDKCTDINFKFTTSNKGVLDINRISITLNFTVAMHDNSNSITFDYLPVPLIVSLE